MNRNICLAIVLLVILFYIFISFYILRKCKQKGKPAWTYLCICFIVVFSGVSILVGNYRFDIHGKGYADWENMYMSYNYYTVDGDEYFIKDNILINVNNQKNRYLISEVLLSKDGFLIINESNEYKEIEPYIYVNNAKERAYDITACYWNIFGKIVVPETEGYYLGEYYIKPIYENGELGTENLLLVLISNFIDIVCVLILGISIIFMFKTFCLNKKEKIVTNELKLEERKLGKYCIIFIMAGITQANFTFANTFMKSFIIFVICITVCCFIMPYVQGMMNYLFSCDFKMINSEESIEFKTLREYHSLHQKEEVKIWKKTYVLISSIGYVFWILYCVLKAFGY